MPSTPANGNNNTISLKKFICLLSTTHRMIYFFAAGFVFFILVKYFEGAMVRLVPPLLLATLIHGPLLLGTVSGDGNRVPRGSTGNLILIIFILIPN